MKSKIKINYIIKALLIATFSVFAGCKDKDILDLTSQNALSDVTAYTTPERIELTVAGTYDAANSGFYAGGAVRGYPFGAAHIEQGDVRGEDVISTQTFYGITYQSTYDPTTPNNDYMWQTLWALINRTNVVLDGLNTKATPTVNFTQASIDAYKGECLFLRALAYHQLMIHFCRPYSDNPTGPASGMPIRKTASVDASSAAEALTVGRSTIAETYDFIIADLNAAEGYLPATRSSNAITRATKGAVIALKTRVYLHMGDWANVVLEGNKLVPGGSSFVSPIGGYKLTSSPYGPFGAGNKSNTESIFSVENSTADNPGVNGALPSMFSASAAPTNGRGLVAISPTLWNQSWFLANDLRKSAMMTISDPGSSGKNGKFSLKYADDVTGRSDNAPVIRYAEVLLNLAEAVQRQSAVPDQHALDLLNAVRNRSVTNAPDQYTLASFASQNSLIQAVLNERRIEFVCEGLRWGDISRLVQDATFGVGGIPAKCSLNISNYGPLYTNDPTTTFIKHAFIPYSDRRFLWPIPSSETSLNPTLAAQQNPNW